MNCLRVLFLALLVVALPAAAHAAVIDFDAVALRAGTNGLFPTIIEYPDGTGAMASTSSSGQKTYYGTDHANGMALSSLDYIEFTYKPGQSKSPYTNVVITNGSSYGVISSQGGVEQWLTGTGADAERRMRFYYAGNSGNDPFGFKFYEPAGVPSWAHSTGLTWADISTWSILGIGDARPLSAGEAGVARGPVDHGVAILWGDSQANYLGDRDMFDVVLSVDGQIQTAGVVPEPTTMAIWALLGTVALAFGWRRRVA